MFKWLTNLQEKSETHRRNTALVLAVSFTLIIVVFWLTNLLSRGGSDVENPNPVSLEEVDGPINSLKSTLKSVGGSFNEITEEFRW